MGLELWSNDRRRDLKSWLRRLFDYSKIFLNEHAIILGEPRLYSFDFALHLLFLGIEFLEYFSVRDWRILDRQFHRSHKFSRNLALHRWWKCRRRNLNGLSHNFCLRTIHLRLLMREWYRFPCITTECWLLVIIHAQWRLGFFLGESRFLSI